MLMAMTLYLEVVEPTKAWRSVAYGFKHVPFFQMRSVKCKVLILKLSWMFPYPLLIKSYSTVEKSRRLGYTTQVSANNIRFGSEL